MSDDEDLEENGVVGGGPPDLAISGPSRDMGACARRDENPFSLRQFLRGEERPGRAVPAPQLPDFVQDHLPVEAHQLSLDLTESVPGPIPMRHSFPLDLPPQPECSGGGLPDFLPMGVGRGSPDARRDSRLQALLDDARREMSEWRARAGQLEQEAAVMRAELRRRPRPTCGVGGDVSAEGGNLEQLRAEVQRLRESEAEWRRREEEVRRHVRQLADVSLRELVQHLEGLRSALEPP